MCSVDWSRVRRASCLAIFAVALHAGAAAQSGRPIAAAAVEEARARVQRGEVLFARGDFRGALTEYDRAYALVAGHPLQHRALFNIAKCYEKLFDYPRALAYYERYVREGGPDAERRAEVERSIRALRDQLATLQVSANVPAEIWIDARKVGTTPQAVPIGGGAHTVAVRRAGYEPQQFEVQLAAGQTQTRHVELERLSAGGTASPIWFWTSTALAGATLGTSLVFGVLALQQSSELDDQLDHPVDRWRADPRQGERIADLALAADVALGAAALFGTTSVVLYYLTDWDGEPGEYSGPQSLRAAPFVARGAIGACMQGTL